MDTPDIAVVTRALVVEHAPLEFSTDASMLNIPPGRIPRRLATTLGNEQPLLLVDHDAQSMTYRQALGALKLTVFNT